ncbi:MAG: S8 family serine peptidase [Gammaproteobacteria bacterium]|nr:S8 family serine peptidase [Gammaproteobacteria bacterium]
MKSRKLLTVLTGTAVALVSVLATGAADDTPIFELQRAASVAGSVLVLPTRADGAASADGVSFEVTTEDGIRTYKATVANRTAIAHAEAAGRPTRYAFDPDESRFRELTATVLVELEDYGELPALVREVGAISGKPYPHLGFALIRLPLAIDPAQAARRLEAVPGADKAFVQFKAPVRRPMRPRPEAATTKATNKTDLASDLLVFFDGIRVVDENAVVAEINVLNWGAAPTASGNLTLVLATTPGFTPALRRVSRRVPVLQPKGSYSVRIRLSLRTLAADTYFLRAEMPVQSSELAGRSYTNSDRAGFTIDGMDPIRQRCTEPGRGGSPNVVDPLYRHQWHLRNTGQTAFADSGGLRNQDLRMGVILTRGPFGAGVKVAVVDTGLETCHPDLAASIETDASYNFNAPLAAADDAVAAWPTAETADPFNVHPTGDHGTSVAGLIAAEARNGIGGRGVAPGARLRGYNMLNALDYDTGVFLDAMGASFMAPDSSDVDVFNMSFGSLGYPASAEPEEEALFAYGVRRLRGERGAVYVKAAGNGFGECGALHDPLNDQIGCSNANGDEVNNLPYVVAVGGLDANGRRASYASAGANLWISAPAGEFGVYSPAMVTTDQAGSDVGYGVTYGDRIAGRHDVNPSGDYTSLFNGTSSAAPNVAGVVAILLEANPELTWRDVKHILADTARSVDPSVRAVTATFGGVSRVVQDRWVRNGAGYRFHNWYGFGGVHANAAWRLARRYVPGSLGPARRSGWFNAPGGTVAIPDNDGGGAEQSLTVAGMSATANIEAVILEVGIDHPFPHDLGIELTSPAGTRSVVNPVYNDVLALDRTGAPLTWRLLSNAFYGEGLNGDWTLSLFDGADDDTGTLNGWRLRFHYGEHP